jgi:hypothetical protein
MNPNKEEARTLGRERRLFPSQEKLNEEESKKP